MKAGNVAGIKGQRHSAAVRSGLSRWRGQA
jgi:hypothetical protein